MKQCNRCGEDKPYTKYTKDKSKVDGYYSLCRACKNHNASLYRQTNKEAISERYKSYYKDNRESLLTKKRPMIRRHYRNNKIYYAEKSARSRATKLKQTPMWFNEEDKSYYKDLLEQQQLLKDAWGISYHIDHIVPLQGKKVSGLHCKENWQLIPAFDNLSKGNSY